jgi:hypothetical protein
MKFTVDLDDFYLDSESGAIEEELKKHIISSVVSQIEKNIAKKIDDEIARCVKHTVENVCLKKISGEVARIIEIGEVTFDRKKTTIEDVVKSIFESNIGYNNTLEKIKEIAKKWGDEIKMRYDRLFAIHIVEQMKKNDLLKEEKIAELLKIEDFKN